jgi:oligopeptide transport system substrate-binding protein
MLILSCRLLSGESGGGTGLAERFGVDREETVFLVSGQPNTLDPAKTHGGPDGPIGHIFSGLTMLDTDLQIQPDLAAGWRISEDGLVYTFFLRFDASFHDGRQLTASDVIYSWERAVNPATGSDTARTYLGDIAGVDEALEGKASHIDGLRTIDDHTLEVRLNTPVIYFLAKLAYPVAFVVDEENASRNNWEYDANGTGPFTLKEWRDDDVIHLQRYVNHYRGPAPVSHLIYNLGPDLSLSLYEADEIDIVGLGSGALERAQDPEDPLAQDLVTGISMCTSTIGLNSGKAPFDDVRVRQAFNYALDKELLIEAFSGGRALPATGVLPPGMPGYTGRASGYPYDPERARQLLFEAGYPNGAGFPALTYTTSGYGDAGAYVTAVITMWHENLDVIIEPEILDPFVFYEELYAGNVGNIYSSGWCADYPDPQNFLDILYHSDSQQNIGGFEDKMVDALLESARVERDVARRMEQYAEIEQMIVEAAPVVFVSHGLTAILVKPRVRGYVHTPIGVPQWHHVSLSN